jgi:hypothetical protein
MANCQPAMINVSQSSNDVEASAVAKHTKDPTQRLSAPTTSAQWWWIVSTGVSIVDELG